jgi:hypothetical protein
MQTSLRTPALAAALDLLAACGAAREAQPVGPELACARVPASALAGAVRALETLDAIRPEGTLTELRALECDTLLDRAHGAETVRVFLHLSAYAATIEEARAAFDQVRLALEAEARAGERVEPASAERVERVMAGLDVGRDHGRPGREDLVSYSDVICLEILPGRIAAEPLEAGGASGAELHDSLESYVRRSAARGIGQVDLAVSPLDVAPGVTDHRFRVAPLLPSARHTWTEIGRFLAALEGGSPGARVTRLDIERSQHEPDVHAARGWTFEAELSVREFEPTGADAAARH